MAVNVQASGRAAFGFGDGNGDSSANLAGVFGSGQPALWSVALAVALGIVIALVALSAWERI